MSDHLTQGSTAAGRATLRSRPCNEAADFQRLTALASAAWTEFGPQTYFHPGDVGWRWRDPDWPAGLRLWEEAEGALAAFASFDPPGDFEFQVHPRWRGRDIEREIMAWGEAKARGDEDGPAEPATWASEGDAAWIALLDASGYGRTGECCLHFRCFLDRTLHLPPAPEGFRLRSVAGEAEAEARTAVHRAAFAPSQVTAERFLRLMRLPLYRADLDVVVEGPDGAFAAFCLCWLDEGSATGLLEPVGVDPRYRGRGLGRAVVAEGLRRLQGLGARSAAVVTGEGNTAAWRLYERCGFEIERRDYRYTKPASVEHG